MSKTEVWCPTLGFEGLYEVSSRGRVRALRIVNKQTDHVRSSPRLLKPSFARGGYLFVQLCRKNKKHARRVHRLVLEAFVGLRPLGHQASHLDGSRTNNNIANLTWMTVKDNCALKKQHGTHTFGETSPYAKLTPPAVRRIRKALKRGETGRSIAARFGVGEATISRVKRKEMWGHVTD